MSVCDNCGNLIADRMWFCNDKCRNENRMKFKPVKVGERC
jgi:hypothetical protein